MTNHPSSSGDNTGKYSSTRVNGQDTQHSLKITSPQMLRHYKIMNLLGEGGMGKVYKAWDTKINRPVALKVLLSRNAQMQKIIERFCREALAVAKLQHHNIVGLYDVGVDKGQRFFTMQYIEGKTLHELGIHRKLRIPKIVTILIKIAYAMDYAHNQKVIHRDLKPANILINEEGEPFVMDFGLAKMSEVDKNLTKTGEVMGTPYYMSPEQAVGQSKNIDRTTDIYSLGVILYELLTGEVPFKAPSTMQILTKITETEPVLPSKINPRIPKSLQAICLKAMNKKIQKRYQSAKELAEDLERFKKGEKVHAKNPFSTQKWQVIAIIATTSLLSICFGYTFGILNQKSQENVYELSISWELLPPHEWTKYGKRLIDKEFYQQAHEIFTKALTIQSARLDETVILGHLITASVNLSKYKQALFYYQKLPLSHQKNPQTMLSAAKAYYYLEDYSSAQLLLNELQSKSNISNQEHIQMIFYLGKTAYELKGYETAKRYLEKVEHLLFKHNNSFNDSYKATLFLYLGNCFLHNKDYSLAENYLKKAQSFLPNIIEVYGGLGVCYLQEESTIRDLNKAEKCFRKCVLLDANSSKYYAYLGNVLEALGDYRQANDMYVHALNIDVENFTATRGLLTVPLKDVAIIETNIQYLMFYLNKIQKVSAEDLLANSITKIQRKFQGTYIQYLSMQKQQKNSPQIFIRRLLQENISLQVYDSIQKGLLTLRYHPQIDDLAKAILQKKNHKNHVKKRLQQTFKMIFDVRLREQKFVAYYLIAKHYFTKNINIKDISSSIDIKLLYNILRDNKEETLFRYLAAKIIIKLLDFKTIENHAKKDDICSIICRTVLKEEGFPIVFDHSNLFWKNNLLLTKFVARYSDYLVKDWTFFKNHEDKIVQLYAAANIAQYSNQRKKIVNAREVLSKLTEHKNSKIRSYAHYSLWSSYCIHNDKVQHIKQLISGLRDPNTQVKKSILFHRQLFKIPRLWEELRLLLRKSEEDTVLRMAMANLATYNTDNSVFDEIIYSYNKYLYSTRALAFMSNLFIMGPDPNKDRKSKIQRKFFKLFQNIPKLTKDPEPRFRYIIYCFLSLAGFQPTDFIDKEQNSYVKSHIIANIKFKLMSNKSDNHSNELKIIKPFLSYKNSNIQKAAMISYASLLSIPEQRKFYKKIKKSKKSYLHEGAATGFYSSARLPILKRMNWEGRFNPDSVNEHYQGYVAFLKHFFRYPTIKKQLYERFTFAIELFPEPRYYYERSLIHIFNKNHNAAIEDLKNALKFSQNIENSEEYIYTIAKIYYDTKRISQAKKWLSQLKKSAYDLHNAKLIAELHVNLGLHEKARKIYSQLILLFPNNKNLYLGLAKCYNKLYETHWEKVYLNYANKLDSK
ncbi:protein kinase [Candidatus Uabimicrobium sp. HlEnr_7]|uniref:protein kinase domain-containing protein n=1 Tax=Candidatus Uabimicrobium helgolandensis TaxID=3095367 RepID=UPI00355893B0